MEAIFLNMENERIVDRKERPEILRKRGERKTPDSTGRQ
jgi:hypothetical protein